MAFKILLIVSVVAVANAHFGYDDDDNDAPPGFRRMYVPPLMQPPRLPGFPQPPPLMAPPPLYAPIPGYHHHHHSVFPTFQMPDLPNPGEIKDIKPGPGQMFSGIAVRSSSGFSKDEDGKVVRTGGSTMILNNNGDVKEAKVGENPPDIDDPVVLPSFPFFKMPEMHKFEPITFKPFVFEPITFKPFVYEPVTFKPVDVNYVPKDGETFVSVSTSSHSESSDVNGVKKSSGGSTLAVNDNGQVEQQGMEFAAGDDAKQKNEETNNVNTE